MSTEAEFLQAVAAGDAKRVDAMLTQSPDLAQVRAPDGASALLTAVYRGQDAVAALLAARLPALDVWEAAVLGETDRLHALLQGEPTLANAHAPDGFTPLTLAAFFGRLLALRLLLDLGADPNLAAKNVMRVRPLHSASALRDPALATAAVDALLNAGARVNETQHGGWTPLHQAASHGFTDLVQLLLDRGADRAARSDDGRTPLEMARAGGHETVVALLTG